MYTNFKDLYNAYNFNKGSDRENLSEEQERSFVNDCFDTYEHIGFAETYMGDMYEDDNKLAGKKFIVLNRVPELKDDFENGADLECLPMWNIRFENGFEMAAYPEEICLAERR